LYELSGIWVEIVQQGKSFVIKDDQYYKLAIEYNSAVDRIFNAMTDQGKAPVASANQKTPDKPQEATPETKAPPKTGKPPAGEKKSAAPESLTLKEQGSEIMKEIGAIITIAKDGKPYFTEEEKEQAREIIKATRLDENGIADLKDFKDFLSDELAKREAKIAA
jgi:hypothetical protein